MARGFTFDGDAWLDPYSTFRGFYILQSKMRRLISRASLAVLILLAGCLGQMTDKAPNIRYGQDTCAECRMIITDARFAGAFINAEGDIFKFDDIGCMRTYEEKNHTVIQNSWVHDTRSEEWIDPAKAIFIRSTTLDTPMGYGIAAFSSARGAEQFLKKHEGQKISWDGLLNKLIKGGIKGETN